MVDTVLLNEATAPDAEVASDADGTDVIIQAGNADGIGEGGSGHFLAGDGGLTGSGGHILIRAGDDGAESSGQGGNVEISAGSSVGSQGGDVDIDAGSSGSDTGDIRITGGEASGGNTNGGYVALIGGSLAGTGRQGSVFTRGATTLRKQTSPAAKTVTAAITAAELVSGLITTTGASGPSTHQLPTGTQIQAELPGIVNDDSFDFTIINTGTGASDDATITVNTGVTIVGNPTVGALTDATIISGSGTFRCRRTASNTYVVYRIA